MNNSKKERLAEFNRRNILEAAKMLFAENGIHQTTMDDIAQESQYSKSTIYVYFKSKEEIFNYIIYEYIVLLKQVLTEAIETFVEFEDCYYAICRKLITFNETYPLYFESILGEIGVEQEEFEKYEILRKIYDVGEEINDCIRNFLEKGITNKKVRLDIKPIETTFTLWVSICGLISVANKKEKYIQMGMHSSKQAFLQYGFETLLRSILNNGDEQDGSRDSAFIPD